MSDANRDQNHVPVALGQSSTSATTTLPFKIDSSTGRLLTDSASGAGSVQTISIASANGFAGTSDGDPVNPELTISTTITAPVLAGNGTALIAATTTGSASTVVLQTSPTLITPVLGVATATSINGLTITATTGTLTLANGSSLVTSGANSITLTSTGATNVTLPTTGTLMANPMTTGGDLIYGGASGVPTRLTNGNAGQVLTSNGTTLAPTWAAGSAASLTVGTTTISSGTTTRILYDNAGVLGEYTLTGSGTVVVMQTAPTFVTSITTPSVLATANDSGAIGASGTAFSDLFLASGGVINWAAADATIIHSSGLLTTNVPVTITGVATASGFAPTATTATGNRMYLPAADTLGFAINGSGELQLTATALSPMSDDGLALGTTALGWQSLFGDTGFVLNIENGNWVATHTSAILTVGTGDLRVTTAGTDTASVVTVGGTQTLTNKTLTAPAINAATLSGIITLADSTSISFNPAGLTDGEWMGETIVGVAGYAQTFGDCVYLAPADSRFEKTDADALATSNGIIGFVVVAGGSDGAACTILTRGFINAATAFPSLTVNGVVYVGETPGTVQTTLPTGADSVEKVVGFGWTADILRVEVSPEWQVNVA